MKEGLSFSSYFENDEEMKSDVMSLEGIVKRIDESIILLELSRFMRVDFDPLNPDDSVFYDADYIGFITLDVLRFKSEILRLRDVIQDKIDTKRCLEKNHETIQTQDESQLAS